MKKYAVMIVCLLIQLHWMTAQQYFSKTGKVKFISDAPIEKIEATNSSANIVLDKSNGNFEGAVLIKGFQFEKAVMQEHFNENYLESHKYPKATFKGNISNIGDVNLSKDGTYKVNVNGTMTMHGVSNPIATTGTIIVKGGKVSIQSSFNLTVADYNIEIPKVVRENISKTVNVQVTADLQQLPTK